MFMTYKETLAFLFSRLPAYHRIGKAAYKNNLDNTIALDEYFRSPHQKFKSIHVAGTNGKGSVSQILSSVLQEAGYRTGLFTSPHLKDFRERIKVNGEMIPERKVTEFVLKHRDVIESLLPSFFEMTTAMAFEYFAESGVDAAVIEVGLGGRLDSTNIISPVLSVITNIGHDHMDILGNTLGKVAVEKAGIIKKDVPVVIGESHKETENVFISGAREKGSEIYFADRDCICSLKETNVGSRDRHFKITSLKDDHEIFGSIPLGGDYQADNLQIVYIAVKNLKDHFIISEKNLLDGIKNVVLNTGLQGRWQVLRQKPLTICDTGHNMEGLDYVVNQIKRVPKTGLHMIIGFVNDKDLSMVLPLFPKEAYFYFTKASVPRALDEKVLMREAKLYGLKGKCYPNVKTAIKAADKAAAGTDMIFIGGSTFIVADALRSL